MEKLDWRREEKADRRCPRLPDFKLGNNLFHWLKAGQSNTESLHGVPITSGPMEMGEVRFNPMLLLCRSLLAGAVLLAKSSCKSDSEKYTV